MHVVLRWIHYLLICALSVVLVVGALHPEFFYAGVDWLKELQRQDSGRVALASAGFLLFIVQALLFTRWIQVRRFSREISYVNDLGKVSVSLVAIEEALTRAIENEAGVRRVTLRVFEDRVKRTVIIEPVLTLWEDHNVTAINHRCQEILRTRFAELMPERTQVQVNLTLHRLNQRPATHDRRQSLVVDDLRTATATVVEEDGAQEEARIAYAQDQETSDAADPGGAEQQATPEGPDEDVSQPAPHRRAERDSFYDSDEELDYESLYLGPTYPVDHDDDDDTGRSR
ncbi:MAG: hypothetical protein EA401_01570 [Planctomycetota bacterium]|nr:MAG: hypothetical protein EA401_01570 [Planctomycetota bacterium]